MELAAMSDHAKDKPEQEGGDSAPVKKRLAGKTLILFIVLPAVLILGGGGAAAMLLLGGKDKGEQHADAHAKDDHGKKDKAKKKGDHGKKDDKGKKDAHGKGEESGGGVHVTEGDGVYFITLPDFLVNIANAEGEASYLKLKLTLEAPDEGAVAAVEPQLPRVVDQFQAFLRELRVDDLAGSAGAYRLRLELLRRVNLAIAPAQVNAVLIEEMLVQ